MKKLNYMDIESNREEAFADTNEKTILHVEEKDNERIEIIFLTLNL